MSVGLLIVTHGNLGQYMLDTATQMLGVCPLATTAISVPFDCDPDAVLIEAAQAVEELNGGGGVLILTDIYGSTPSNIVNRLLGRYKVQIVAGVNVPMLIRVLNYPRLNLSGLANKAVSGGRDGVLLCHPISGN